MSILGNIMTAILESKHAADVVQSKQSPQAPAGEARQVPREAPQTGAPQTTGAATLTKADINSILKKMDDDQDEDLDWQHSIVDLMKLLNLDSSLRAREHLAHELGYTGALDGSAKMNNWLHAEVMKKLAESGGKVPDSLRG